MNPDGVRICTYCSAPIVLVAQTLEQPPDAPVEQPPPPPDLEPQPKTNVIEPVETKPVQIQPPPPPHDQQIPPPLPNETEQSPKDRNLKGGIVTAGVAGGLLIAVPFALVFFIQKMFSGSITSQGSQALSTFLLYALILGAMVALSMFLYGYYQKGTRSRLLFGMTSGPLIMIYSFVVLVISGLASVLSDIGLHLDTTFAALMIIFASVILMFNIGTEYIASIRGWREPVDATKAGREALDGDEAFAFESELSPPNIGSTVPGEKTDYEEEEIKELNVQDGEAGGPITPERPILGYGAGEGKSSGIGGHEPEPIDLSSLKTEFSLRIGSLVKARKSMTSGYLRMVLMPTVLVLAVISLLSGSTMNGVISLFGSMDYMLAVIAVMAIPIMVVCWANGLYPKGSYGKFVSALIFATLLCVWLILLLIESHLQDALAGFGMVAIQLEMPFIIVCLVTIFFFGRAIFELIDERKLWRKSLGAKVEIAPLNLKSRFLDFNPHIGKLNNGNSSAMKSYIGVLIMYSITLAVLAWAWKETILENNLGANNLIDTSFGMMFDTVLLFGIVMVFVRFIRGFYPRGSFGRMTFGLMGIPILLLFAWEILLGSGIQEAFRLSKFIVDMSAFILPMMIYILFITVIEMSELVDKRRSWHRKIGMRVEPYIPEERYGVLHDFRPRYASFVNGGKKGKKFLSKYIFREISPIIIVAAILVSLVDIIPGMFQGESPIFVAIVQTLLPFMTLMANMLYNMVGALLILVVVGTSFVYLQKSYRKGSFSRLVFSMVFSLFSALWAYVFWGTIANGIMPPNDIDSVFDPANPAGSMTGSILGSNLAMLSSLFVYIMYALIILAGIQALLALSVYVKKREEYLGWRLSMLEKEGVIGNPPSAPSVPTSDHKVLDPTAPLPIGNPQQVLGPIYSESDQQPLRNCVACEREISLDALICPFCRYDYQSMRIPPERPDEIEPEPPPPPTD